MTRLSGLPGTGGWAWGWCSVSLSPWGGGSISLSTAHVPASPLRCICAQASEAKGRATWSPAGRAGQRPCSVLGWSPFLQQGPRGLDHVERGSVAWSLADLGLGSLAANLGPGLSGSGLHSGSFLLCVRPLDPPSASLSLRFLTCEVQRLPTLRTLWLFPTCSPVSDHLQQCPLLQAALHSHLALPLHWGSQELLWPSSSLRLFGCCGANRACGPE